MTEEPENFDALPDQTDQRVELRLEQRAMEAPRWMSAAQRSAFYHQDLIETFGAEYLAEDLEGQAVLSNFPKRSSRKEEKPKRIPTHESTTSKQQDLFG